MCMSGSGGPAPDSGGSGPSFQYSKFFSKGDDGKLSFPSGGLAEAPPPPQAGTPINLKEDLGIVDPLDDSEDGKDKNTLKVSEDDTVKNDKFKRRQTKQYSGKPRKQAGFMNVVT